MYLKDLFYHVLYSVIWNSSIHSHLDKYIFCVFL